MHFSTILLLVFVLYSCQNSTGGYRPATNHSELRRPVDSFLKEGVCNVIYYASKQLNAVDRALLHKSAQLIKRNEHTSRFFEQLTKGETPTFTTNMGMTKKEFQKLTNIFAYERPKETRGQFEILQKG